MWCELDACDWAYYITQDHLFLNVLHRSVELDESRVGGPIEVVAMWDPASHYKSAYKHKAIASAAETNQFVSYTERHSASNPDSIADR